MQRDDDPASQARGSLLQHLAVTVLCNSLAKLICSSPIPSHSRFAKGTAYHKLPPPHPTSFWNLLGCCSYFFSHVFPLLRLQRPPKAYFNPTSPLSNPPSYLNSPEGVRLGCYTQGTEPPPRPLQLVWSPPQASESRTSWSFIFTAVGSALARLST